MEKQNRQAEIVVKLLASGRYIWSISITNSTEEITESLANIKRIDTTLKDIFPEFSRRGSGRIANLDEEMA